MLNDQTIFQNNYQFRCFVYKIYRKTKSVCSM